MGCGYYTFPVKPGIFPLFIYDQLASIFYVAINGSHNCLKIAISIIYWVSYLGFTGDGEGDDDEDDLGGDIA